MSYTLSILENLSERSNITSSIKIAKDNILKNIEGVELSDDFFRYNAIYNQDKLNSLKLKASCCGRSLVCSLHPSLPK